MVVVQPRQQRTATTVDPPAPAEPGARLDHTPARNPHVDPAAHLDLHVPDQHGDSPVSTWPAPAISAAHAAMATSTRCPPPYRSERAAARAA